MSRTSASAGWPLWLFQPITGQSLRFTCRRFSLRLIALRRDRFRKSNAATLAGRTLPEASEYLADSQPNLITKFQCPLPPLFGPVPKSGQERLYTTRRESGSYRVAFGLPCARPAVVNRKLLTLTLLAGSGLAQDSSPLKLTLHDAVVLALKQNPQVILANLGVSQSEQERLIARSA